MSEVETTFCKFAIYGDRSASGNNMTGKNFKLCKGCRVMDGKAMTSTDIDIIFNKVECGREAWWAAQLDRRREWQEAGRVLCKRQPWGFLIPLPPSSEVTFLSVSHHHSTKGACTITFAEFQQAIRELCSKHFKGKSPEEALQAIYGLIKGKEPSSVGATKATKAGGVKRLTDTSNYTGSHKEHFDESGKGKGLAGHQDLTDSGGYVGAYAGAGTMTRCTRTETA